MKLFYSEACAYIYEYAGNKAAPNMLLTSHDRCCHRSLQYLLSNADNLLMKPSVMMFIV